MRIALSSVMILGSAMAGLTACDSINQSSNFAQGEAMERALLQCKQDLEFAGQTQTEVVFENGALTARVLPFDQIDEAAAAQINACANGATVLDDGLVVVPMTAAPANAVAVSSPLPQVTPATVTAPHGDTCPAGVSGLYRGTLYCGGVR